MTAANSRFNDRPLGVRMIRRLRSVMADPVLWRLQRTGLGDTPLLVY